MKEKLSFENYTDHIEIENSAADHTKQLENTLGIHSPEEYNLSERNTKTWCSYMENGFRTSRIISGAVTGTHDDVSISFAEEETYVDKLQPDKFMK